MFVRDKARFEREGIPTLAKYWNDVLIKFCLNCEATFYGKRCPWCDGHLDSWVWLSSWKEFAQPLPYVRI